jgi:hypothetical protein
LGWKRGRLAAAWKWVERELVDEAEGEGEAAGAHRRISPITAVRVQPLRYFLLNHRLIHVLYMYQQRSPPSRPYFSILAGTVTAMW